MIKHLTKYKRKQEVACNLGQLQIIGGHLLDIQDDAPGHLYHCITVPQRLDNRK